MKRFIMFIALVFQCSLAPAESSGNDPVATGLDLIAKGKYDAAISTLTPITESSSVDSLVRGRAWTLLGFAYKEAGQFQKARRCYEQALSTFGDNPAADGDRAATFDNFGSLQEELGNLADAQNFLAKAAEIGERIQDHFRVATVLTEMAGIGIEQKHYKVAKKDLQTAVHEASQVHGAKMNLIANLYATKGWLESVTGNKIDAAWDYRESLEACKRQYGDQHPLTGWSYLQLGKAFAEEGNLEDGIKEIRDGLAILEASAGKSDLRYLVGEVVYAEVLDRTGAHAESVKLGSAARQALDSRLKNQCASCTISSWSLHQ
jgi:tetratricopeptide (TPR) repeat protein